MLKAYWPLNDNSDSTVRDYISDNHGTVYGASSGFNGLLDQTAYDFNGSSDYIKVENGFLSGSTLTASVWVKIDGKGDDSWNRIIDIQDGKNNNTHGFVWDEDDNRYGFFTPSGNAYVNTDIATGTWLHLTGVLTENEAIFYVNGIRDASVSSSSSFSDLKVCIGKRYDKNDHTNGKICEVRLYDRPLTPQEVQYLYQAGRRGVQTTSRKTS